MESRDRDELKKQNTELIGNVSQNDPQIEEALSGESELSDAEIRALAAAYARFLKKNNMQPGETIPMKSGVVIPNPAVAESKKTADTEIKKPTITAIDEQIFTVIEDTPDNTAEEIDIQSIGNDWQETAADDDNDWVEADNTDEESENKGSGESERSGKKKKERKKKKSAKKSKKKKSDKRYANNSAIGSKGNNNKYVYKSNRFTDALAAPVDAIDNIREKISNSFTAAGENFIRSAHNLTLTYRQSRIYIGIAFMIIGLLAAAMLIVFDMFTVYEYSYNGKVMGYVKNQETVTDILGVAGTSLTSNNNNGTKIEFVANQNVTFSLVDAGGKSTDDSDMAVNKLIYMTDIEIEAFGVYDGTKLVGIVKSNEDAEMLLSETLDELSRPDNGMELVSAEFTNELSIKPVNVLLTSVQSNSQARSIMTKGGSLEIYHIVEENETLESIAETFGVELISLFDESNKEVVNEVEQGDKICIHSEVEPVSVKMVETGRMRETIEYETIKKDSDEYYKGDTFTEQEGVNGIQIFDGTVTKVGGEIVKRRTRNIDVLVEKQDKIILVGTAERPKTAPTGTYAMPIDNYTLTSNLGYRWGRLHSGIDMAAPTGTPIYASDGGTIIRAGWYAGYGLCVEVDHENGRVTRYGHCSKLLVNVGDKVYQRQNICLVGNTGHSFGSHLHFEVLLNGSPVNPRPYLGI